ncbi:hypothetical protein K438DRAFT_101798 [Mycena galopus ATCC 62051]|nr:hypothetical protein K438DRAFT_101798 [Mycena galopus ATCC 62051]
MDESASLCSKCGNYAASQPVIDANAPPGDSEVPFIHSTISKIDTRLARIDDEIFALQKKLGQLKDARASLFSHRTWTKAILSPLRRMPPEVLGEIFMWTLPSIGDALRMGKFDMTQSPWLLTQISSRWSAVAISIPSLWSRITIDYTPRQHDWQRYYSLELVKMQIQRAQELKIHFYGTSTIPYHPQGQIFELLAQQSSRWEEFSVGITSEMIPSITALRDRLPLLTRTWVQWENAGDQIPIESLNCFQTAPSLANFSAPNEDWLVSITLPTHRLTRLRIRGPWESLKGILASTEALVEANLTIDDDNPWQAADNHIYLPHLRRLFITHPKILESLTAPVLEGVALCVGENEAFDISLAPFLDRSACPLGRLCIRGWPDVLETTKILQRFPCITELVIIQDYDSPPDINFPRWTLTLSGSSAMAAPQLSALLSEDDTLINYEMFLTMLKSWGEAQGSALKKAALVMGEQYEPELATFEALQAPRREGFDFRRPHPRN